MSKSYLEILPNIKALFFDVDGVLTDGSVSLMPDGSMIRSMGSKDGYILHLAAKMNIPITIITGGNSEVVKDRLLQLGVQDVYLKSADKLAVFEEHLLGYDLKPEECLYMGDDIPDYEVMTKVGLACCPADAAEELKKISHYISPLKGGEGCVRDIVEQFLKIHNKWFKPEYLNTPEASKFTW
ncbi:MAG: HAD hydrolase family protein [Salibacteraceae bacterium]|nr:HAD hydrolase family protein [Salibacteraceae bacterium]|tara:strand:+ start:56661 stop:57209 length:549 start_codon:yes stop_codon:yes gene_type:complete